MSTFNDNANALFYPIEKLKLTESLNETINSFNTYTN